jgi:L-fucose isomerase-like protein
MEKTPITDKRDRRSKMKKTTFAVIVGNRGFFPDVLAKEGRKNILGVLKENGYGTVALSMQDTKYGTVETFADAKKCAALFASKADSIDGIIVTLPNFGDEKGVAETIKRSGLCVPILIHAEPDDERSMKMGQRRDSFCGKFSVCNNLRQAGISYTLTGAHTVKAKSAQFKKELDDFASVCRIIKGLNNARFGAIGARTGAFNTVRFSEKLLELSGLYSNQCGSSRCSFEDGQVRLRGGQVDKGYGAGRHGYSMLDQPGRVLWNSAVHRDEYDE